MEEEIHNLLTINQIEFEKIFQLSIFNTYYLPKHKLHLHLITIQKFQESILPKDYFQKLSDTINAQGERIIHLGEDVWLNQKDLVQSRILAMIGKFKRLNARHCIIERIDKKISDNFLNINHLQGSVNAKFKYGLFLKPQYIQRFGLVVCEDTDNGTENEHLGLVVCEDTGNGTENEHPTQQFYNSTNQSLMIAVATFSGGRLMKYGERMGERSYELIRFASLRGYSVMGGMDKLLKAFELEHNPDDIMSYADRDWSDGRSYEILGFERIENIEPQTFLLDNQIFKRHSVKENVENCIEIFNAGSIKFIRRK